MEPFFAANACPRCGSSAASYTLHETACPKIGAGGEHMHRQCPACGHEWAEAPRTLRISGYTDSETPLDE